MTLTKGEKEITMAQPKVYTQQELDKKAKSEVRKITKLELELANTQKELATNPQFAAFLDTQKKLKEQTDAFWKKIKDAMIASGIKNIKGDWGWITLGETFRYNVVDINSVPEEFKYDDLNFDELRKDIDKLDKKYITESVDTAAIKEDANLTGEVPDGVEEVVSYKLMKKIKPPKELE